MRRLLRRFRVLTLLLGVMALCLFALPLLAADVTPGTGDEDLRVYVVNGGADVSETWTPFIKGLQGDYVIVCDPATVAPVPTSDDWTQVVTVTLETADGEQHCWYNGPIKIAIADTSTLGTASITPTAGAQMMTNGSLTVTIAGDAKSWANAETATLTVSDPDTTGFGGWTASNATCVITFTTGS